MKVRDLTRPAHYVNTDDSVKVAAQVLAEKNVNALFVRAKGEVVGILTVRDLLKFAARCDTMAQAKVKSIMSQPVLSIEEGENVMQAGKLMEQHDIRHLGVKDKEGKIVGMITATMISRNHVRLWYRKTPF